MFNEMQQILFDHAAKILHATRLVSIASCKICGEDAYPFDMVDFNKSCDNIKYPLGLSAIPVIYRKCANCKFVYTDFFDNFSDNQWRHYIYNDEYIKIDPEYVDMRPRLNARIITATLGSQKRQIIGLDYGGGNGKTALLLRENGWIYDSYDPYGHSDVCSAREGQYNFCSSFEVFEHSPSPIASLREIVSKSSQDRLAILIGTQANDGFVSDSTRLSWSYAAPRNGHISLFSKMSMHILADKFGLRYLSLPKTSGTHLLTRGFGENEARVLLLRSKVICKIRTAMNLWSGNLA